MRRALATGACALLLAAPRLLFLGLADVLIIPLVLAEKESVSSSAAAGQPGPGFRRWRLPARCTSGGGVGAGFRAVESGRSGIQFTNRLEEASAARNRILENGSGVALGDVDGNGLSDL